MGHHCFVRRRGFPLLRAVSAMLAGALALAPGNAARAQIATITPGAAAAGAPPEEVLVEGRQPGPGMWRVKSGDHTLWILGSLTPLPKKMSWDSSAADAVLGQSQELILPGTVRPDIGFFHGMLLLPSLMSARKNPDGKKLVDILPPDLYARWAALKARYIGHDDAIESWRPLFAAMQLYSKAIDQAGLERRDIVQPEIAKLARDHKLRVTDPAIKLAVDKPHAAIKEFSKIQLSDVDCLAATISRLESDLGAMRVRANAWARGDLRALRGLPFASQRDSCLAAVMGAETVQERGLQDLPERIANRWLDAAVTALRNDKSSFAVLSMDELVRPDGRLAALKAKGFEIEEPAASD